jgi:hypothetical protein
VVAIEEREQDTVPEPSRQLLTFRFAPVSMLARSVTLRIEEIWLQSSLASSEMWTLDLGSHPEVGDRWPVDRWITIEDVPVHIIEARLGLDPNSAPHGEEPRYELVFTLHSLPVEGMEVRAVHLGSNEGSYRGGASSWELDGEMKASLQFDRIPSGEVEIRVDGASLAVSGPWAITWALPGRGAEGAFLRRLESPGAQVTRSGVTLQLEEIVLSDRLTAVDLAAVHLPEGSRLIRLFGAHPRFRGQWPRLEDHWARSLAPESLYVQWQPETAETTGIQRLVFLPIQPLTQSLRLTIPAVELLLPGEASFGIDVPDNLAFEPEEYTVHVVGGGGPEREQTEVRWVSPAWPIDLRINVAGFTLHFNEARLQIDRDGSGARYRLALVGTPGIDRQDDMWLDMLHFSQVVRPDGTAIPIMYEQDGRPQGNLIFGGVGHAWSPKRQAAFSVMLDVTNASGDGYLPGWHEIHIDGASVSVRGPWQFNVDLGAP